MEAFRVEPPVLPETVCWCGAMGLKAFSPEYDACTACGTLVSRVGLTPEEIAVSDDSQSFYGKDYWLGHQVEDLGNPDIIRRSRTDLPERCLHWLRALLRYKPAPGRVLEIGCAHGAYVSLLNWAGYEAVGLEMSPWVVEYARQTFGVPMLGGPIEEQNIPEGSLDAIVLNDVVEHLSDPLKTLRCCARLLKPDGILVVQMPEYPEGMSYEEMVARKQKFLDHIQGKQREHLNLFSVRSARHLFEWLGFSSMEFLPAMFAVYDQFVVACRQPLVARTIDDLAPDLMSSPAGRMRLAWFDLMTESAKRDATLRAVEADRAARLDAIHRLDVALSKSEADRAARLDVIQRQDVALRESEADRAARLVVINTLSDDLKIAQRKLAEQGPIVEGRLQDLEGRLQDAARLLDEKREQLDEKRKHLEDLKWAQGIDRVIRRVRGVCRKLAKTVLTPVAWLKPGSRRKTK